MTYNPNDRQLEKEIENEQKKKGVPEKSSYHSNWLITVIALIIIIGALVACAFLL